MSSYLVTGGAGFIGSNIAEELLRRGETVRILDNFSEGTRENLDLMKHHGLSPLDYELIEGDIRDMTTCLLACRGMDYVLHQAALRSVPRSVDQPSKTNEVNVAGTLNILLAAREARVKRVVYASSSSIYGDSAKLPQSETDMPAPLSPYAVSKLAAEHYCVVFNKIFGLETVCLRYFNVFGPRQNPTSQYAQVIPRFILSALHGRPLEIHGDGLQSRDFTYVSNVVEANIASATAPNVAGEVINIGCGEQHSVMDVADAIAQIMGRKLEHYSTEPRLGDARHTRADISKAKGLLRYTNRVTFMQGIRTTIEHFEKTGYQ
jgi:UDP-glucose 4-epimerase